MFRSIGDDVESGRTESCGFLSGNAHSHETLRHRRRSAGTGHETHVAGAPIGESGLQRLPFPFPVAGNDTPSSCSEPAVPWIQ